MFKFQHDRYDLEGGENDIWSYLGTLVYTCHDGKTRMFYDSFYYEPIGLSQFISWSYRNWDNPPLPLLLEVENGVVDSIASLVEGQQQ